MARHVVVLVVSGGGASVVSLGLVWAEEEGNEQDNLFRCCFLVRGLVVTWISL